MKTRTYITALIVLLMTSCGVRRSQTYYSYDSELIGTEMDGTYTIRAWGRARNAADAYVQAQKQAVYDIIFEGVRAMNNEMKTLQPLVTEANAREKYEEYFNQFFKDGGEYRKYSTMKEKRTSSSRYVKNRTQMMCHTTVCVDRVKLKQRLINDNIIK